MRRARKIHSAKWDHCVEQIKKQGRAVSPQAVCTASLREQSFRRRNPLTRRVFYLIAFQIQNKTLWLNRRGKVIPKQVSAARFNTVTQALDAASRAIKKFPMLAEYPYQLKLGY